MTACELRTYGPGELLPDGYPVDWPQIKDHVRAAAGHRCERCRHPYRTGEHGNGEWSRCDRECRHAGPVRVLTPDENGDLDPWESTDDLDPAALVALLASALDPVEARWRILTVHHLNGHKADCRWWNLAALCQRCHLQIQGRVNLSQVWPHEHSGWFKPHAAGYYAVVYLGQNLSRNETLARLDELLALERSPA